MGTAALTAGAGVGERRADGRSAVVSWGTLGSTGGKGVRGWAVASSKGREVSSWVPQLRSNGRRGAQLGGLGGEGGAGAGQGSV